MITSDATASILLLYWIGYCTGRLGLDCLVVHQSSRTRNLTACHPSGVIQQLWDPTPLANACTTSIIPASQMARVASLLGLGHSPWYRHVFCSYLGISSPRAVLFQEAKIASHECHPRSARLPFAIRLCYVDPAGRERWAQAVSVEQIRTGRRTTSTLMY